MQLVASACLLHPFHARSTFCFFSSHKLFNAVWNCNFQNTIGNFLVIICSMHGFLIAVSTSATLTTCLSSLLCLKLLSYYCLASIFCSIPKHHVFTLFGTSTFRYTTRIFFLISMFFDICSSLLSTKRFIPCWTTWTTCKLPLLVLQIYTVRLHSLRSTSLSKVFIISCSAKSSLFLCLVSTTLSRSLIMLSLHHPDNFLLPRVSLVFLSFSVWLPRSHILCKCRKTYWLESTASQVYNNYCVCK